MSTDCDYARWSERCRRCAWCTWREADLARAGAHWLAMIGFALDPKTWHEHGWCGACPVCAP